jgi:hypothetical protein
MNMRIGAVNVEKTIHVPVTIHKEETPLDARVVHAAKETLLAVNEGNPIPLMEHDIEWIAAEEEQTQKEAAVEEKDADLTLQEGKQAANRPTRVVVHVIEMVVAQALLRRKIKEVENIREHVSKKIEEARRADKEERREGEKDTTRISDEKKDQQAKHEERDANIMKGEQLHEKRDQYAMTQERVHDKTDEELHV